MSENKRRRAWRFGMTAEFLAAAFLVFKGYSILARRYKTPVGEIDLVARRGRMVCFIEVKGRRDNSTEIPVKPAQMKRVARASLLFIQSQPSLSDHDLRFDILVIRPWHWPMHMIDAWRPH